MRTLIMGALLAGLAAGNAQAQPTKPTIVLVHGAFADSSSWNGVISFLEQDGYRVVGAPNPLRGVRADADVVADLVRSIAGPVILVGHSYGGSVISEAAAGDANVKGLVYVAAFAPDVGETAIGLTGKFPGSTLGPALAPPVSLGSGGKDLYILQARFHDQFAADVPPAEARLMAAGQRPIAEAALSEAATQAAWKTVPSWFIYGDADRNIPPAAMAFMAQRAAARQSVVIRGASHVVMVSHAPEVARLIEKAATAD
ncbi:alpha/beta hydrolase [Sphingobium sp. AP49]|uniref:alpha/beta fold hydrolase n=1 Tax=Sphingobium sp. AP49 TaxID=1144307 RepID=UPI00026EDD68|nr:alpha/beta hydrolase [Sphingobium sp. AP49]WHO40951.1 alpha/beta hydrolase [Sphingobium sp. AP49]